MTIDKHQNLTDRIAKLLIAHPDKMDGSCCGAEGLDIEYQEDWARHLAAAIVAELGMAQQWTWTWLRGNGQRDHGYAVDTREEAVEESGEHYRLAYRYVTEWTADD